MALADPSTDFFALAGSPEFRDDPYPVYQWLRDAAAVHETPYGVWLLTRHADVAAVVRDPQLSNDPANGAFADERAATGRVEADEGVMLFLDPPDHTRMRGLVN